MNFRTLYMNVMLFLSFGMDGVWFEPWSASSVPWCNRLLVDVDFTVNCCLGQDILLSCYLGCKLAHFRMVCCYQFIMPFGRQLLHTYLWTVLYELGVPACHITCNSCVITLLWLRAILNFTSSCGRYDFQTVKSQTVQEIEANLCFCTFGENSKWASFLRGGKFLGKKYKGSLLRYSVGRKLRRNRSI